MREREIGNRDYYMQESTRALEIYVETSHEQSAERESMYGLMGMRTLWQYVGDESGCERKGWGIVT
jgi:hypothetical protein